MNRSRRDQEKVPAYRGLVETAGIEPARRFPRELAPQNLIDRFLLWRLQAMRQKPWWHKRFR